MQRSLQNRLKMCAKYCDSIRLFFSCNCRCILMDPWYCIQNMIFFFSVNKYTRNIENLDSSRFHWISESLFFQWKPKKKYWEFFDKFEIKSKIEVFFLWFSCFSSLTHKWNWKFINFHFLFKQERYVLNCKHINKNKLFFPRSVSSLSNLLRFWISILWMTPNERKRKKNHTIIIFQ